VASGISSAVIHMQAEVDSASAFAKFIQTSQALDDSMYTALPLSIWLQVLFEHI